MTRLCRTASLLVASLALASVTLAGNAAHAQAPAAPQIREISPPNWWANMPKPMLLVEGEGLSGANFSLSDASLRVVKTNISANGHWAELWLSASPASPETVTLRVHTAAGDVSHAYRFDHRRAANDGFGGFSSKDAMYMIMTDRFADGDPHNDGVNGTSAESSAEAAAERVKPRGWHGGDLRGIQQHLDYIQKLGFDTVWMTPVYANEHEPDSYHGYGATDMYAVDPHYGSLQDLRSLADALHHRGMKLVLDTVPNHVGPANPWAADEPDPNWLHGTLAHHDAAIGDFRPLIDPYAPWRDQRDILEGWFANVLPDLNQENAATSQYLIQNALWWVEETGADGLRIDTFPYVCRPFWHKFHATLHDIYPNLRTVGEVMNADAVIVSSFAGGVTRTGEDTGLDTPFDYPTCFALRDVFMKHAPMTRLVATWEQDGLYPHPERLIPFFGNHDISRIASAASPEDTRLAFAVLFTMRGMPESYAGDEIGMKGGDDPDNRHDFPGGWAAASGSNNDAFTHPAPDQATMQDWVRHLLKIRNSSAALRSGTMQILDATDDQLAYLRSSGDERVVVIVNRSDKPADRQIDLRQTALSAATSASGLMGDGGAVKIVSGTMNVHLPANGAWIGHVR